MLKSKKKGESMHTEKANAKINAYLNITSRRANGYHDIVSVMQTISLCDFVTVDFVPAPQSRISLFVTGNQQLSTNSDNLAYRAAECFLQCSHRSGDVQISIQKQIPVSAGLGGGSADAAAVLRALNRLCGQPLTTEELCQIGLTLGADVPFCIRGGTMLATGVGEVLERVVTMPPCVLVVSVGKEGISTPKAYAALDQKYNFFESGQIPNKDVDKLLDHWQSDALAASCTCFYNIFEDVIPEENTNVDAIKSIMRKSGAMRAMMSGSGPAVFGVFETSTEAEEACSHLQQQGFQAVVCQPCGEYIE